MTFWGIVALALGATAMLFANLSAILPENMMTGLHSTRLDGGNLNHLRTQVAELRDETARIRSENDRLMTMLTLAEQDQNAVTRRVGAIESSLPVLLENTTAASNIDRSIITSGISGDNANDVEITEVDGGAVAVSLSPLEEAGPAPSGDMEQSNAMPTEPVAPQAAPKRIVAPPPTAFGVALGPQVTVQDAYVAWKDITNKAGPLLLGLGPLLSGNAGAEQQRLVAGPIQNYAQAEQVCVRMIRIGISCLPVPYAGQALPE